VKTWNDLENVKESFKMNTADFFEATLEQASKQTTALATTKETA